MRVKFKNKGFLSLQSLLIVGFAVVCMALLVSALSFSEVTGGLKKKRANLIVRKIGHELLLHAGDSASRVLPVTEISQGVFQLRFAHDFSFKPDTLVAVARRSLASADIPSDYMVNVYECVKNEIVYGFEIRSSRQDIEACNGRIQPTGCYVIEVTFVDMTTASSNRGPMFTIVTGLLLLVGFGFAFVILRKSNNKTHFKTSMVDSPLSDIRLPSIGKFSFDIENHLLHFDGKQILLTDKECKVLSILNQNLNSLTDREHLIKEVWEREGVITGRSLDMFISKLRKKLSEDPFVKITNVHGRGYRLEVLSASV